MEPAVTVQTETRSGLRTTELWVAVISNVLVHLGVIDIGDPALFTVATTVAYILSRGLSKLGVSATEIVVDGEPDLERAEADRASLN